MPQRSENVVLLSPRLRCVFIRKQRCEGYIEVASHTIGSAGTRDGAICPEGLFKMQSCHRQAA